MTSADALKDNMALTLIAAMRWADPGDLEDLVLRLGMAEDLGSAEEVSYQGLEWAEHRGWVVVHGAGADPQGLYIVETERGRRAVDAYERRERVRVRRREEGQ